MLDHLKDLGCSINHVAAGVHSSNLLMHTEASPSGQRLSFAAVRSQGDSICTNLSLSFFCLFAGAETGREFATKMHTQNLNNLKTLHRLRRTRSLNNRTRTPHSAGIGCRRSSCHPRLKVVTFQIKEVQVRYVLIRRWHATPRREKGYVQALTPIA